MTSKGFLIQEQSTTRFELDWRRIILTTDGSKRTWLDCSFDKNESAQKSFVDKGEFILWGKWVSSVLGDKQILLFSHLE